MCIIDLLASVEDAQPQLSSEQDKLNLFSCILIKLGGWKTLSNNYSIKQSKGLRSETQFRLNNGMIVGFLFKNIIKHNMTIQSSASMISDVYQEIWHNNKMYESKKFKKDLNTENIAVNLWREFKCVAHLWAALSLFTNDSILNCIPFFKFDSFIPYAKDSVDDSFAYFLVCSNMYLEKGLTFKAQHSNRFLLDNKRAIKLILNK